MDIKHIISVIESVEEMVRQVDDDDGPRCLSVCDVFQAEMLLIGARKALQRRLDQPVGYPTRL